MYATDVSNGRDRAPGTDLHSNVGAEAMTILQYLIDLVASFFSAGLLNAIVWPVMLLCFLASVPCLIRKFWR